MHFGKYHLLLPTLIMVILGNTNAVPPVLHYAGQVTVNREAFDGVGLFKFALVNADGNESYWSNDGTSVDGSEPQASVSVPVNGGLYAVLLGNTAQQGMGAIDPDVFAQHSDAKLRVWFSDGVNGFQQLSPDRPFASVPYAFSAGTAQTASSATIADGAIDRSMLSEDIISDLNRTISHNDLSPQIKADINATIGLDRLSPEIILKLEQNATIMNGSVTGSKMADGSVTASKIASNAITTNELSEQILKYLKPEILKQPIAPDFIFESQNIILLPEVNGKFIQFQWYKNGQKIINANSLELEINDFNASIHSGNYCLVVKNDFGEVISNIISIFPVVGWTDFDDDGFTDKREIDYNSDPKDSSSFPGLDYRNEDISNFDGNIKTIINANFEGLNLDNKRFHKGTFNGSNFRNASMKGGDSVGAKYIGANFEGANLTGRNLSGANLTDANLTGTVLTRSWFSSGTIWPEGFDYLNSGAWGPGVDFTKLDISSFDGNLKSVTNANFEGLNLDNKRFHKGTFNGSNFRNASMKGGDSVGAKYIGANFEGANLTGRNLSGANLTDAIYNLSTIWPDGFDPVSAGAVLSDNQSVELNSTVSLDLNWCSPGSFIMGNSGIGLAEHNVTLTEGFFLGKFEVTQAQYEAVMSGNTDGLNPKPSHWQNFPNRPVENISWNDIQVYLIRINTQQNQKLPNGWEFILPTEAQWEYACRAGTTTSYSWGTDINSSRANYNNNVGQTSVVGLYPPNGFGFHDMNGNVYEWVSDWYSDYGSTPQTNPKGPESGTNKCIRGAGFNSPGSQLKSAYRYNYGPGSKYNSFGFRIALIKNSQ
jgi:formylglycine-generating enzyme required for sulfatase activity/uncharacterized protein YjbI with pentapeptide repeats